MKIHFCLFNKTCREEKAPIRLYMNIGDFGIWIGRGMGRFKPWQKVELKSD